MAQSGGGRSESARIVSVNYAGRCIPDPMATTKQDLTTAAGKPKKVVQDGTVVEQHSLKDQIDADDRVTSTQAVISRKRGILLTRTKPPGSV